MRILWFQWGLLDIEAWSHLLYDLFFLANKLMLRFLESGCGAKKAGAEKCDDSIKFTSSSSRGKIDGAANTDVAPRHRLLLIPPLPHPRYK